MENELTSKEGFNRHFMSSLLILLAEEWHDRTGMIQAARERIHIILNLFMIGCVTILNSVDGNSLTTHKNTPSPEASWSTKHTVDFNTFLLNEQMPSKLVLRLSGHGRFPVKERI